MLCAAVSSLVDAAFVDGLGIAAATMGVGAAVFSTVGVPNTGEFRLTVETEAV
jgi:hypothetical protein